ncbi:30S ribosomal protein S16 [Trichinella spiralis]|uniref:30S ribosomal protein S16 n=1 Tax=Trichinella spiralis TaxID=6334 RepID=UPI0001EFB5E9|nr:30S ribosomal protein S16 [Trichinella spiralis]
MLCVRMQNTRNKPPYAIYGEDMKNGRNTTNEQDASGYWLSVQMRFTITAKRLSLITII